MSFKPTDEQSEILEAFKINNVLKVNSIAGAGKSSTLMLLAQENKQPSLYVCFNKQNATEAATKFPDHTECRTMHSLAYSVYGKALAHKITTYDAVYINRGRTGKEIVNLYSIDDFKLARSKQADVIPARKIAVLAKETVSRFQNSDALSINEKHIPFGEIDKLSKTHKRFKADKFKQEVLDVANKLWTDKVNPHSPVKADHDTYQKLYQLSSPVLPFDVIYLDEAQDSSPVVLDIIAKQTHCKKVYVGDTYQSIYAFRQAVNAMELITAPTYLLSKSFRYGDEVASLAKYIINDAIDVKGDETINSKLYFTQHPDTNDIDKYTMIFRTNSALLERAVEMIGMGVKVKCEIDANKFKSMISSSKSLFVGDVRNIKDDEIAVYSNWNEMLEDSKDNPEIKRLVDIVLGNKVYTYVTALDSLIKASKQKDIKYDVLLTTAHKSKGMEWDNVVIADDFNTESIFDKREQQEVNLYYVACTRAIETLQIPYSVYKEYSEYLNQTDVISEEIVSNAKYQEMLNV